MNCPKCGEQCFRDEVHNGIALLCGPWGCPACAWSDDPRFDFSDGKSRECGDGMLDQFGGYTPPSHYDIVSQ